MVTFSMETTAWYLDKFGIERECVVIRVSGVSNMILGVRDLDGRPLDVNHKNLYYVPRHAEKDNEGE